MRSVNRITWMWDEALHALEQAERQYRRFCGLSGTASAQPTWEPPADVLEIDGEVRVLIALPGVSPDAVSVQITAYGLLVTAERPLPAALERMRVRRLEIPYGRFERRIELASGQYVLTDRRIVDGCLDLRLARE
jgi:HSP20 family molecular chaperone IbpA